MEKIIEKFTFLYYVLYDVDSKLYAKSINHNGKLVGVDFVSNHDDVNSRFATESGVLHLVDFINNRNVEILKAVVTIAIS